MKINVVRKIPGLQVHHASGNHCIASRGLLVVQSEDQGYNWRELCRIPAASKMTTPKTMTSLSASLQRIGLYRRLVRGGIHAIRPIQNASGTEWVAVASRQLYHIQDEGQSVSRGAPYRGAASQLWDIPRGRRPLRRGLSVVEKQLFIGEYWANAERDSVYIYRIDTDSGQSHRFYEFPPHSVRHIHTVDVDPYAGKLWVSTGDADPECKITLIDPKTGAATILGEGSQTWRTVSFAFRPDAVYWGTDNHLGKNQIWRYDRIHKTIQSIVGVVGPVYYNVNLSDYILFGTTMEKGEGQQDGFGRLYGLKIHENPAEIRTTELLRSRKDRMHPRYFGYGVFEFAEGCVGGNRFWLTPKGFVGREQSLLCEIEEERLKTDK